MDSNHFIRACGSISKKESLLPLDVKVLKDTCVAEANHPYPNYYGMIPERAVPNSIFLFTKVYYTLEETLRFSQKIKLCAEKKLNIATSTVIFKNNQYPAIRIKYLPNYNHIAQIQTCFREQGVVFAKKIQFEKEALVKTNKCLILEKVDDDLYMDVEEKNKGYILIDRLLTQDEFYELLNEVRQNANCMYFDSAKGGIIINSEVKEIVRIYSEQLNLTLLKCIQSQINKVLKIKEPEYR